MVHFAWTTNSLCLESVEHLGIKLLGKKSTCLSSTGLPSLVSLPIQIFFQYRGGVGYWFTFWTTGRKNTPAKQNLLKVFNKMYGFYANFCCCSLWSFFVKKNLLLQKKNVQPSCLLYLILPLLSIMFNESASGSWAKIWWYEQLSYRILK